MVGATLPFQFGAGAKTVQRPLATSDGGFAGAMDEAIGAPAARRDDAARHAPAARSRRPEPVSSRGGDADDTPVSRRRSSDTRDPAVDRIEDRQVNDEVVARPDREDETAVRETRAEDADECAEPSASETGETPKVLAAPEAELAAGLEGEAVIEAEAEGLAALGDAEQDEAGVQAAGLKQPVGAAAEEAGEDAPGAGRARGRGWNGPSGLPEHGRAHDMARSRAELTAAAGEQAETRVEAGDHPAHPQTGAGAAQAALAATAAAKAAEPPPSPAQAAAEEAVAAFAEAGAAVEGVAAAEQQANADVTDSGGHEHDQTRTPAPATRMGDAVASASGLSDGVRFTATAAGSAAYASAAPRPEVHVLPQIVQSIKLQTAQGTSEARVQLRPEHLGALNIALKVENGHVTATIHAENPAVRQWIEANETSLRQALSEQGLQLSRLVVHPDGQQTEQDGREPEPRRQPRRRSWRDEDVTFEVLV